MGMQELAVSMLNPASLGWVGGEQAVREAHWRAVHGDAALAEWLARFTPTHLYFGSEFCEHLLPTERALRRALASAEEAGLRFALLTPVASPLVVRRLKQLLALLPEAAEVVVNDWGVAHLVAQDFPALRPIAGRLLCRMVKDPRLTGPEWAHQCGHGLDSPAMQAVFGRVGFQRLEIDVPLFAESDAFSTLPLPKGVHLPYGCVAKGRMCRPGSMSITGPERFAVGRRCRKECLSISATTTRPGSDDAQSTRHVGNAIFSRHTAPMLAAVQAAVQQGFIERLVVAGESL